MTNPIPRPRRADPAYEPVRAAGRQRQRTSPDFQRAMDASPPWIREAIARHCESLRGEAAAYRVEAKTHRLRLEEITRSQPGARPHEQDNLEVQP